MVKNTREESRRVQSACQTVKDHCAEPLPFAYFRGDIFTRTTFSPVRFASRVYKIRRRDWREWLGREGKWEVSVSDRRGLAIGAVGRE